MNQRDLSERLEDLAILLEGIPYLTVEGDLATIETVAQELRKLSNENYAPGNGMAWTDIKPSKPEKKTFVDKSGRKMPF